MNNNLLQSQIHENCKLSLPEGLKDLMSDISREVLRAQPQNLHQFIANYLEALLEVRDVLSIAHDICNDTCECDCEPELHSELKAIGLEEDDLDKAVEIIGAHLKKESVNEPSLLAKLVKKTSIDELYMPAIQGAVQRAFKRQQLKNTKRKYSQNDPDDKTTKAVHYTIKLYQRRKPKNQQRCVTTDLKSCSELKSGDSAEDFNKAYFQEQDRSISNNVDEALLNTNDNELENDRNYDFYHPKYIIEDEEIQEEIVEQDKSKKNSIVSSVDESLANADDSDDGSM